MFSLKLFIRGKKVQFQYAKGVISLPPASRCGTTPLPAISPIQSSFIYCQLRLIPHQGHGGAGSSVHHQTPTTFTHNWEQLSISDQANLCVFGLWEATTAPGEHPHRNIKPRTLTTTMLFTGIYLYHLYLKWARLKEKQKQMNIWNRQQGDTLLSWKEISANWHINCWASWEEREESDVKQLGKRRNDTWLWAECHQPYFPSLASLVWSKGSGPFNQRRLRWSQHASNRLSSPLCLIYAYKHRVRSEIHIL